MVGKIIKAGACVWLLCGAMLGEVYAEGGAGSGTVAVTVLSGDQVLANTTVGVRSWSDANFGATGTTNQNGVAELSNVPVGRVDVFAMDGAENVIAKAIAELVSDNELVQVQLIVD